jgi:NCAIR mutase (PurE)-related protein
MRRDQLLRLLETVANGDIEPGTALERIAWSPVEELGGAGDTPTFARVDHQRATRQGFPEVVFCEGKETPQIVEICARLADRGTGFLATRAGEAVRAALQARFPMAAIHATARIAHLAPEDPVPMIGTAPVLVISAGTSDLPVAEEAAVTAAALGNQVERLYDVGVAGIHRLLRESAALGRAGVVIVVAGMEGALPSVVGGLVRGPVIAVPTSVGYGAAFGGLAALLGMLNSCAAGLTVVNIDNGFGAACAATRINQLTSESN